MAQRYFNIITFHPGGGGTGLVLTLDNDWVMTPGVEPNVNTAVCSYKEFDKLPKDLFDLSGDVCFWFHGDPTGVDGEGVANRPDVRINKVSLVSVDVSKWGRIDEPPFNVRITEYRLYLADRRQAFVWPRGGFLQLGDLNAEPFNAFGTQDRNGQPNRSVKWMVERCLEAMGEDVTNDVVVPAALSDVPRPMNVQWRGNHAPTELAKLLEHNGYVLIVRTDGHFRLEQIGDGNVPEINTDQALPPLPVPNVDRRGKIVVITSHPNAVVVTQTFKLNTESGSDFDFVVQDDDDVWKPLAAVSFFQALDPVEAVKTNFFGVPEKYRARVATQTYRCIRLDPGTFGPTPMLRWRVEKPAGKVGGLQPIQVRAILPVLQQDGSWVNSTDLVTAHPAHLLAEGAVLTTSERLGKIDGGSTIDQPDADFAELEDDELEIRVSYEAMFQAKADPADQGGEQAWRFEYFTVGFQQDFGGIRKLSDDELNNALAGPDPIIVPRPELKLLRIDGKDVNRTDLEGAARDLAPRWLRNSGTPTSLTLAKGFQFGNCSGKVAEVRYTQGPPNGTGGPLTTFKINTWWLPHGQYLSQSKKESGKEGGASAGNEAHPQQAQTEGRRTALGESGSTQPAVPVLPAQPPPPPKQVALVQVVGPAYGGPGGGAGNNNGGKYQVRIESGPTTAMSAGNLAMPEGLQAGTLALGLNAAEDGFKSNLLTDGYYLGWLAGPSTDNPPVPTVVLNAVEPACFHVSVEKDNEGEGGSQGGAGDADDSGTTTATYTYTVRTLDQSAKLGEKVAPKMQRSPGHKTPGTWGIACISAGKLVLIWVDEVETTDACDDSSGSGGGTP
jgi:hypothetical protein